MTLAGKQTNLADGATWIQEQYLVQQTRTVVRRFSCGDGLDVGDGDEVGAGWGTGLDGQIETLVTHLEEKRVLLLSAERGAGKVAAALYLGAQLRQAKRCSKLTLVSDSLDRQVRIDVRHLAERDKGLAGRVIIFRKPFGRADPELARLFEKTDRADWEQLTARLRQQNAYLVFTADPKDAALFHGRAALQGFLRELPPHLPTQLESGLDDKLQALEAAGAAREPLDALRAGRKPLLESFHFSSSLAEFVDFFVDHFRPDLGLDDAIARFHDSSEWLLQELERDFEFWSFGFTLALAQCAPNAQGIAWMDFDRLHRRVRQWLRRDLNQRPTAASEEEDDDSAEIHPALSEERLLRRCRAEIIKDSSTLGDVIQFRDGAPPQRLWTVILERHRRALTTILPGLRELAENGADDLRSLRILAAQILGRLGEVDPHRVTFPLLERWVRSDKGRHHGVVGPLFDGVTGSGSERYRSLCLGHLRHLRRNGPQGALHAAIGAYSWIGDHDLSHAMRELGEIAREHLAPLIGDMQQVGKLLADLERELRAPDGVDDRDSLIACHRLLRDLMGLVYENKKETLLGVQGTLVSLCLTAGAIPVFRGLLKWVEAGGWKTGVLIALMFLHDNGIANALKASKVEVDSGGSQAACNPLILWVAAGNDEVRHTARFLGELYESLTTAHGVDARMQRYCRESLQGHLLDWARDAAPFPDLTAPMRSLFEALATTHEGKFREPMARLLERREFHDSAEPRLRAFGASVRC
ncbi:hypothetical protein [Longimicrobium terrae]|uniref:Uncharacterized protein n=1 Tax=Longimicrobium terrae TaxID=1639882 RepID=A0A841H329_9BACT|nr:hypothetical protein [Longimicrobium terrae]MBB4638129.1 hypothetical protein [Longimicrobium terrae]MBB6072501.1 hypothetical protein [Longimicrobium terrae]NNC32089.1 hypothetical protein [Longimicrobium terrae]